MESIHALIDRLESILANNRKLIDIVSQPGYAVMLRDSDYSFFLNVKENYEEEIQMTLSQKRAFDKTKASLICKGEQISKIEKVDSLFLDIIDLDTKILKILE